MQTGVSFFVRTILLPLFFFTFSTTTEKRNAKPKNQPQRKTKGENVFKHDIARHFFSPFHSLCVSRKRKDH